MADSDARTADRMVVDARRAVHESLVRLPAWDADHVRGLLADLETAVEARTAIRLADQATPACAFRVTEIRDNTVRRVHGYHTTLEGAFAYCEVQERTPSTIPSARFELLPDPSGKRWLVLSYYKPDDPCPEVSDLVITRVDIHAAESTQHS
jgi:hypothetical protein